MASAYVVNAGRVLLVHHRKIGLWLPAGGHIEPGEDPTETALREVKEETGLSVCIVSRADSRGSGEGVRVLPTPHHVQVERIAEGPHEHIDLVYVCAVESGQVERNAESDDIRWFTPAELESTADIDQNVLHFALRILAEQQEGGVV